MKGFSIIFTLLILLNSCQNKPEDKKQIKTELYFGMSNAAGPISSSEWLQFRKEVVENMLSGFTELKGEGYWKSESGTRYYENSVILLYIHEQSMEEEAKIDSLINLFKERFDQESVLQTDQEIDYFFK